MSLIVQDQRFLKILTANIFSSIGSGITMIAIPWMIVTGENGASTFGIVSLILTIMLFLIAPIIGNLVDQYSRKTLLLGSEMVGFIIISLFAIIGFINGSYATWHLVVLFASGMLYYSLFYPTMFAMNQEIFEPKQYKSLNGMMEIQGQLSAVVTGGIASLLIDVIDFQWILLIDAITYVIAFFILCTIPYTKTKQTTHSNADASFWGKMREGFIYLKERPLLFLFLFSAFIPFVAVMITNFVFPIYIESTLQAGGTIYAAHEMLYGIGALVAGMFVPFLIHKFGNIKIVLAGIFIFMVAIILTTIFPITILFLVVSVFFGLGNAGTRVARNTLMMEIIPNDKMGRVESLFRSLGLALRIALIGSFTIMIPKTGTLPAVSILSMILIVSLITAIIGKLYFKKNSAHAMNARVSKAVE
ncbi:MFS transporter [Chengkuizengella axinellae]|uniref:MFS transporter n=1 Tax=Chengkuizengella axinellae TaxID=3064388 RepID=A0ABT9J2T3_9BACL|nr:MFS transporter [Chengkuizengella sp. 2205SS18-9]MDP5275931.1 MFS transporter [Chengkuizengella sp. 2205SS18-9]